MAVVTVAIPIFNGAPSLPGVLSAVRSQQLDHEIELLVCDSGSTDGSRELAVQAGARVIEIAPETFDHSTARNLLMEHASGEFVAMLTQDAEPIDPLWLTRLLEGFELASDVALVYGPYVPRPDCPAREADHLERFFAALSRDRQPRVDRLEPAERELSPRALFGHRTYFTDANGCVRREAWQRVPFPRAAYAEDQALAVAMLKAGYAKVFVPAAGVLHSHHYTPTQQMRRDFDDWRGLLEVYGWREPAGPRHVALQLRGAVGQAQRRMREEGVPVSRRPPALAAAAMQHALHLVGATLGSRADRLPARVRRAFSLDGRSSFQPVQYEAIAPAHRPR
jgi:rhamnosyltransferase